MSDAVLDGERIDIQGWRFTFPRAGPECSHEATIRSPSGDELRLSFTDTKDELYTAPVWWLLAAIDDAADEMEDRP